MEVNKFMKIYLILKDHKFVFYSNNQKSKKNSKSDAWYSLELECGWASDDRARSVPELWGIPHARARPIPEHFDPCPPLDSSVSSNNFQIWEQTKVQLVVQEDQEIVNMDPNTNLYY